MDSKEQLYALVLELSSPEQRESALLELSKKREEFPELAPILWHSFGTVAALLQEIVAIYPLLSPPQLTAHASNRVCNALALLQCVASHSETRTHFLNAHIPLYLYPFLNTVSKNRPFEYLRLTSLGVIGALVKIDDSDVINFLLQTEIIPLCLRIMEAGSELSKTVATFIVQKILLDDMGLTAKEALRQCLPEALRNHTFDEGLKDDATTSRWLAQLLYNISTEASVGAGAVQGARLSS
ncbi:Cell differentiation protein rcd1 [Phytophthora palmivora]|uniref:Cell differentiation protein rcd1 n=1 Tax=Phytophthora palmivora TaxID=4796 RepID=A0A2P4XGC2_9STRA|nr:Cell differentiation protein rcd1 [Phytophthora palmivora]